MKKNLKLLLIAFLLLGRTFAFAASYTLFDGFIYKYSDVNNCHLTITTSSNFVKIGDVYYTTSQYTSNITCKGYSARCVIWDDEPTISESYEVIGNKVICHFTATCHSGFHKNQTSSLDFVYYIDSTPPLITYDYKDFCKPGSSVKVNVVDSESDVASSSCEVNGVSYDIPSDGIIILPDSEGTYTVTVTAIDNLDNSTSETITVVQDATAPSATIDGDIDGEWRSAGSITAADSDSISGVKEHYWTNGNGITVYSNTITFGKLKDISANGKYSFKFYTEDNASNSKEYGPYTIKLDVENPTITVADKSSYISGKWANKGQFDVSLIDNYSGIDWSSVKIHDKTDDDGVVVKNQTNPFSYILEKEGEYNVWFEASDIAGNKTETTPINIKFDNIAPEISYVCNANVSVSSVSRWAEKAEYTINVSDEYSGINWSSVKVHNQKNDEGTYLEAQNGALTYTLSTEGEYDVWFEVTDNAGNRSVTEPSHIGIDNGNPSVTGVLEDATVNKAEIVFNNLKASGSYNKDLKLGYAIIDDSTDVDKNTLSFSYFDKADYSAENKSISLDKLICGNYKIVLVADDCHGHKAFTSHDFRYDTNVPVIEGISFKSNDTEMTDGAIIQSNDFAGTGLKLTVSFNVSDDLMLASDCLRWSFNGGTEQSGKEDSTLEFDSEDFVKGKNTFTLYAVDSCDNKSEKKEFTFIYDDTVPVSPSIKSTTHKAASSVLDANNQTTAVFEVRSSTTGTYGITGYYWSLYTCTLNGNEKVTGDCVKSEVLDPSDNYLYINIQDLESNKAGEFYLLKVNAVGTNNVKSNESLFMFRVDTNSSDHLTVRLTPQVDSNEWYNCRDSIMSWSLPDDKTGVKYYGYKINEDENWTEITDTSDCSKVIRLSDGLNTVYFMTENYAGNQTPVQVTCNIDTTAPSFGDNGLAISKTADVINISFEKITDEQSNVDYLELYVTEINSEGTTSSKEYTLLADETKYDVKSNAPVVIVQLKAFDKAGNSSSIKGSYGNEELINKTIQTIDLDQKVNGITFTGKIERSFVSGDVLKEGTISLPSYLEITKDNKKVTEALALDVSNTTISEGCIINTYTVPSASKYSVIVNDLTFNAESIGYSADDGLYLKNVDTSLTTTDGNKKTVTFDTVYLGNYPVFQLKSDAFKFESAVNLSCDGFALNNVSHISLINNSFVVGNDVYFTSPFDDDNFAFYKSVENDKKSYDIGLEDVLIKNNASYGTFVSGSYVLHLNGTVYSVESAHLEKDKIVIDRMVSSIMLGEEKYTAVICGIILKKDGTINSDKEEITLLDSTGTEVTSFTDGKLTFNTEDLKFSSAGYLTVSGKHESSDFVLNDVRLNNDGLDYTEASFEAAAQINTNLYGFDVSAQANDITFTTIDGTDALFINKGTIVIYDNKLTVRNVAVDLNDWTKVLNDGGTIDENLAVKKENYSAEDLTFKAIKVNEDGIYGSLFVPVDTETTWTFANTRINEDESIAVTSEDSLILTEGGFAITSSKAEFDGSKITVDSATAAVGFNTDKRFLHDYNDEKLSNIVLNKFIFTHKDGFSVYPSAKDEVYLDFDGWHFKYEDAEINSTGFIGDGKIVNDEYRYNLRFDAFNVKSDGTVVSGTCEKSDLNVLIGDYVLGLGDAQFKETSGTYVLSTSNPSYTAHGKYPCSVPLGATVIYSNGSFTSELIETETVLNTSDGYTVNIEKTQFTKDGLKISGTVTDSVNSLNVKADDQILTLEPNNSLKGEIASDSVKYTYAGWEITGSDITFNNSSFTILHNTVTFRGAAIDLGALTYNRYRKLVNTFTKEQSVAVSILNQNSRITSTSFSRNGLSVGMHVGLTGMFSNIELYYSDVILYDDDSYYVEKLLEEKQFSINCLNFELRNISLANDTVYASEVNIDAKTPDQQEVNIALTGLSIGPNGINLENSSVSPFSIGDMTFGIDEFSILDNEIKFTGFATLPESLPGVLSGMTVKVDDFHFDTSFNIYSVNIYALGTYMVNVPDTEWSVTFTDLGIEYAENQPKIVLKEAGLIFPSTFNISTVDIKDVSVNLSTGKFQFSEAEAELNNIGMNLEGINLELNKIKITGDYSVGLTGSASFKNSAFPEFLQNAKVDKAYIEIDRTCTLTKINITASNLSGSVLKPGETCAVKLDNGTISVSNTNADNVLQIGVSGGLVFTDIVPMQLADSKIEVKQFVIEPAVPRVKVLEASVSGVKGTIGGVSLKNVSAGIKWSSDEAGYVEVGGTMVMPSSLPEGIANSEVALKKLKIGFDGSVDLDAQYNTTETIKMFDSAVLLDDVNIAVSYSSASRVPVFGTAAKMTLSTEKFPEGIGGITTTAAIKFTPSTLISFNADCSVPDTKFYGIKASNLWMSISKSATESIPVVGFTGKFVLPDQTVLPQGIANAELDIGSLSFRLNGDLISLNAHADFSDITIYDAVCLEKPGFTLSKGTGNEIFIDIKGDARIVAPSMPESVRNATLNINEFRLSTVSGVKNFDVGLTSELSFTIFGGVELTLKKLSINKSGFSTSATAALKYPGPVVDTTFVLTNFAMNWDGTVTDIQGGLGSTAVTVAGFKGSINGLYFIKDPSVTDGFYVKLDSCRFTLPSSIPTVGGKSLYMENADFKNRKFNGTLAVDLIDVDIVGFTLEMEHPAVNFTKKRVEFTKVGLDMPSSLSSASVELKEVTISSSGLQFNGGKFRLPGFTIGDNIGFNDIIVAFYFKNGQYSIEGSGGVTIPNAGQLSAKVAFTNKSSTYPIGLKYAYFSYEVTGVGRGIPIGSTGLFMTGIRGGLAYGAPNEIPASLRYMFDDGARISLGVTVKDQSGGKLVKMTPDLWIDVSNVGFAFNGDLTVLSGTLNLSANANACLTRYGFQTGMTFKLKVVKGTFELYIFTRDGAVKFSGSARVEFGFDKGSIYHKSWKVWRWRFEINIPTSSWWFGPIGADFGDFTNGQRGFLAYVNLPMLGRVGVFAGTSLKIGGVGSYQIVKPTGSSMRAVNMLALNSNADGDGNDYYFTVGTKDNKGITVKSKVSLFSTRAVALNDFYREAASSTEGTADSGLSRLVFVCGYAEGDPQFSVTSPDGIEYVPGDANVETTYSENSVTFAVLTPAPGTWKFNVTGLNEGLYSVDVLTVDSIPDLTVEEPSYEEKSASDTIRVAGYTNDADREVHIFAATSKTSSAFEIGTVMPEADGNYNADISTDSLSDGTYYIIARTLNDEGNYNPASYSAGTYKIDRSALSLKAPEDVRISEATVVLTTPEETYVDDDNVINTISSEETEQKQVLVNWTNVNGKRTAGYIVKIESDNEERETAEINVGDTCSYSFTGYDEGETVSVSVKVYDAEGNNGEYSEPVTVKIGAEKDEINVPSYTGADITLSGYAGEYISDNLYLDVKNYKDTDTSYDYVLVNLQGVANSEGTSTDYISVTFEDEAEVSSDGVNIPYSVAIDENCPEGNYVIKAKAVNGANRNAGTDFNIKVEVQYPTPLISSVDPEEINGNTANTVTIFGSGFISGTRYYFNGNEVAVTEDDSQSNVGQKVLSIPACTTSGDKEIKAVGPSGLVSSTTVNVVVPDYDIMAIVDSVTVKAGETAVYPIEIDAVDGYVGTPSLSIKDIPDGLKAELPVIAAGSSGNVSISAVSSMTEGSRTVVISGDNGKTAELTVNVVVQDKVITPVITAIDPYSVFEGSTASIYGYGFGTEGKLYLNSEEIEASSWTDSLVTFKVPEASVSGNVIVANADGKISNEANIFVHKRGFTVRAQTQEVSLIREKSTADLILVNGYSDAVDLTVTHDINVPFTAELSRNRITPSGSVSLVLTPEEDAVNGEWTVNVSGVCGDYESSAEIKVKITDRPEINAAAVYDGNVNIAYKAVLNTENAIGDVTYSIDESGSLPSGLSLSSDGIISGTPKKRGKSTFTIVSEDSEGQKATKTVAIIISDDVWSMTGKDAGSSRSTAFDMPSTSSKAWTVDQKNASSIFAADSTLFTASDDGVTAYSLLGKYQWSKKAKVTKAFISGSYMYILTKDNVLEAFDMDLGSLCWSRENVADVTASDSYIIAAATDGSSIVLDSEQGEVKDITEGRLFEDSSRVVWTGNSAYEYKDNVLKGIYGSELAFTAESTIQSVSCDANGFVIVDKQNIYITDSSLNEKARVAHAEAELILTGMDDEAVFVSLDGVLAEYGRKTAESVWTRSGVTDFAVAHEKVAVVTDEGIAVINRYTGNNIWSEAGSASGIALYGERLYAALDGKLVSYNGSANATAPVTTIKYTPEQDGNNGWFKTKPELSVDYFDNETYVDKAYVKYDDGDWQLYEGPVVLDDGYHVTMGYGIDSGNWRGDYDSSSVKVDSTKPVTTWTENTASNEAGWYESSVEVTLEAADALSGVDCIMVNGKEYTSSLAYTEEGKYDLEYYAIDRAGNEEEHHGKTLLIDFYAPETSAEVKSDTGISVVKVNASDSGSGIDYVEYSIDGAEYVRYQGPVVILDEGSHVFKWQAVDRSSKTSGIQSLDVTVAMDGKEGDVLALSEMNGTRADEIYPFTWGSMLYTYDFTWNQEADGVSDEDYDACYTNFWSRNCVQTLPQYVINGEYIKWKASDLKNHQDKDIEFYVKKNAVIYMYASPDMEVDGGWFLLDEAAHVQDGWYSQGWKLYMRRASKAEHLTVNVPSTEALPIIIVKEEPEVKAELVFERFSCWDDVYYDGAKPYRYGVQIHIDVNVDPQAPEKDLPVTRKWTLAVNGKEEDFTSLWYNIPLVEEDTELKFTYTITSQDGKTECLVEKTITVEPPTPAEELYPWYN